MTPTVYPTSPAPIHRVPLVERLSVWFHNLRSLPFQLARRYMAHCLRKDNGLYIAYHANMACRLMDLQAHHIAAARNRPIFSVGSFDFKYSDHRNSVAADLLQLVFDLPTDTYLKAYGHEVLDPINR